MHGVEQQGADPGNFLGATDDDTVLLAGLDQFGAMSDGVG